jgi:murein DD-endopeptidase MepM/ murein hydrolase activator NlpD
MDQTQLLTASTPSTAPATTSLEKAPSAPSPDQLRVLAAQFEAMLMGQMLKQMQSAMFGGDDEEGGSGFAAGPLGDAMYSELSLALSRAGGMGLTESMLTPLMRQSASTDPNSVQPLANLDAMMRSFSLPDADASEGLNLTSPIALGPISSSFGWRPDPFTSGMKFHQGTDIALPIGQEVPAAQSGTVTFAGEQAGYGLTVLVEHGARLATRYAHLSEALVAAGDRVELGQTIAKSGVSGRATGPHLHFEVLDDGRPVDPSVGLTRLGTSVQLTD